MFTGIVEAGKIASVLPVSKGLRLVVRPAQKLAGVKLGESIAVNGVCLTVAAIERGLLAFDVIRQTLRVTNLGVLKPGDEANLERALRFGDRLSGHYVLGHVEAAGKILAVLKKPKEIELRIELPKAIARWVVLRGCIAVDGISLTVSGRRTKDFSVHLIPHTWKSTNLRLRKAGDRVNLESDILLKTGKTPKR